MAAVAAASSSSSSQPVAVEASPFHVGQSLILRVDTLAKQGFKGYSQEQQDAFKKLADKVGTKISECDLPSLQRLLASPEAQLLLPPPIERLFPSLKAEVMATNNNSPNFISTIFENGLFLGGVHAYIHIGPMGITHVVKVSEEQLIDGYQLPPGVTCLDIGTPDATAYAEKLIQVASHGKADCNDPSTWFASTFQFIDEALKHRGKVLVHCAAGVSRSATIIIAYLMSRCGISYGQALAHVKARRPIVNPNEGFVQILQSYDRALESRRRPISPLFSSKLIASLQQLAPYNPFTYSPILTNQTGSALLIGSPGQSVETLQSHHIRRVIQIRNCRNKPMDTPREISTFEVPLWPTERAWEALCGGLNLRDSLPKIHWFFELFSFIDEGLENGEKILIHCSDPDNNHGLSSAIAIAYLMRRFGVSFTKAVSYVHQRRSEECISSDLDWGLQHYGESISSSPKQNQTDQLLQVYRRIHIDARNRQLSEVERRMRQLEREAPSAAKKLYDQMKRLMRLEHHHPSQHDPDYGKTLFFDSKQAPNRILSLKFVQLELIVNQMLKAVKDEKEYNRYRAAAEEVDRGFYGELPPFDSNQPLEDQLKALANRRQLTIEKI
jgi:protein-tyrosine phosphatase